MPTTIRPAHVKDVECLGAIERAAETLFPEGLLPKTGQTTDPDVFTVAVKSNHLLIAEVDETTVGFALHKVVGECLHLAEMSVHPDFGRRGIGRSLVETTLSSARDRGFPGVSLTTFSHIPWNRPFYERCGFTVLDRTELSAELDQILQEENAAGFSNRVAMLARLPWGLPGVRFRSL
ncbi:MAG: GNAT family N-acetyltransferase [bacterium]